MEALKRLKKFKPGDPLKAEDINNIVDAITVLYRADNIDVFGLRKKVSGGRVQILAPRPRVTGSSGAFRPFEVRKISPTEVVTTAGKCHWKGSWVTPTWDTGAFETAKTISATSTLQLRLDVSVDGVTISSDSVNIGWDITASNEGLPAREYEIDFTGETITETGTDAEVVVDIATVTFASGKITDIDQILDYNPILPWNRDINTTVIAGGTS